MNFLLGRIIFGYELSKWQPFEIQNKSLHWQFCKICLLFGHVIFLLWYISGKHDYSFVKCWLLHIESNRPSLKGKEGWFMSERKWVCSVEKNWSASCSKSYLAEDRTQSSISQERCPILDDNICIYFALVKHTDVSF